MKAIRLLVENPESRDKTLKLVPYDKGFKCTTASFRASPIFPAFAAPAFVPADDSQFTVAFFFCRSTFSSLGVLSQELANHPAKQRLWISHGLASIILITDNTEDISKAKSCISSVSDQNLIGVEVWSINSTANDRILVNCDAMPHLKKLSPVYLEKWGFKDPDLETIVDECVACLNTLKSRAATYTPELLPTTDHEIANIRSILKNLKAIEENTLDKADEEVRNAILQDSKYREEFGHRFISELIEYNSVLSYAISQGVAGHSPLLENECQIRNHSLLGIGNSYRALVCMHSYVAAAFENLSLREQFRQLDGTKLEVNQTMIKQSSKWPEFILPDLGGKLAVSKKHFVYFSGRSGFRETHHAIISAMQVLSAADTPRWSLLVNSHEYMHSLVRALLALLLPADLINDHKKIEQLIRKYRGLITKNAEVKTPLSDFLRFICLHYLTLRTQYDSLEKFTIAAKAAMGDKTVPPRLKPMKKTQDRADTIAASEFKEVLAHEWPNLNEIMAHTLDFIYFYDRDPALFIPAIWLSWSTVPSVVEQTEEYLLRTISVISVLEKGQDECNRFSSACEVVKTSLAKLVGKRDIFLIKRALKILEDVSARQHMMHCFLHNICLVDLIDSFFRSESTIEVLRGTGPGFSDSAIEPGNYDLKDVSNPVFFIKERLRRLLLDIEGTASRKKVEEEFSSLWLLLTCASVYRDSD